MALGAGGQAPQQLQAGDIATLASSAALHCMSNGAPPPQVPQLVLVSSAPPMQQAPPAGGLAGDAAGEAHALAHEAAQLQAQAQSFKVSAPTHLCCRSALGVAHHALEDGCLCMFCMFSEPLL
jgi:hypothetical protein